MTFGRSPNIKAIIRGIFEQKRNEVPEFSSDEHAIIHLENLLKKIGTSPILLVLDDVWSSANNILHEFQFQIPAFKILLTSRFAFPEFSCIYHLKPLNYEDAMSLFSHSAFEPNTSSIMPDQDVVKTVPLFALGYMIILRCLFFPSFPASNKKFHNLFYFTVWFCIHKVASIYFLLAASIIFKIRKFL